MGVAGWMQAEEIEGFRVVCENARWRQTVQSTPAEASGDKHSTQYQILRMAAV